MEESPLYGECPRYTQRSANVKEWAQAKNDGGAPTQWRR